MLQAAAASRIELTSSVCSVPLTDGTLPGGKELAEQFIEIAATDLSSPPTVHIALGVCEVQPGLTTGAAHQASTDRRLCATTMAANEAESGGAGRHGRNGIDDQQRLAQSECQGEVIASILPAMVRN